MRRQRHRAACSLRTTTPLSPTWAPARAGCGPLPEARDGAEGAVDDAAVGAAFCDACVALAAGGQATVQLLEAAAATQAMRCGNAAAPTNDGCGGEAEAAAAALAVEQPAAAAAGDGACAARGGGEPAHGCAHGCGDEVAEQPAAAASGGPLIVSAASTGSDAGEVGGAGAAAASDGAAACPLEGGGSGSNDNSGAQPPSPSAAAAEPQGPQLAKDAAALAEEWSSGSEGA